MRDYCALCILNTTNVMILLKKHCRLGRAPLPATSWPDCANPMMKGERDGANPFTRFFNMERVSQWRVVCGKRDQWYGRALKGCGEGWERRREAKSSGKKWVTDNFVGFCAGDVLLRAGCGMQAMVRCVR